MLEHSKFGSTLPDTNRYFLPVYIPRNTNAYWQQINAFHIWNLQSVVRDEEKCVVSDGGSDIYYLITKGGIRTIRFYAADFYEECSPSDRNRRQEILTRNVIKKVFKP